MKPRKLLPALIASVTVAAGVASAEPTDITVKVISNGAKFIGTSMGGVRVTLGAPRLIEVTAYGPLAQQQATHTVSATQWTSREARNTG